MASNNQRALEKTLQKGAFFRFGRLTRGLSFGTIGKRAVLREVVMVGRSKNTKNREVFLCVFSLPIIRTYERILQKIFKDGYGKAVR